MNSPKHRVAGAQRAGDFVSEFLRGMSHDANQRSKAVGGELRALEQSLLEDKKGSRGWLRFRGFASRRRLVADRRLSQYFQLRIDELALAGVCRLAGLILAQVTTLDDRLRNLAADFHRLAEKFQGERPSSAGSRGAFARGSRRHPPPGSRHHQSAKARADPANGA